MSKTEKKHQKYSAEFKLCILMDTKEHHLGLLEAVMNKPVFLKMADVFGDAVIIDRLVARLVFFGRNSRLQYNPPDYFAYTSSSGAPS